MADGDKVRHEKSQHLQKLDDEVSINTWMGNMVVYVYYWIESGLIRMFDRVCWHPRWRKVPQAL